MFEMESYGSGVRRRTWEMLVTFAQVIPIFAVIAYISSSEKALLASTIVFSIWAAVSARREGWRVPGFWRVVALIAIVNAVAIWAIPINGRFPAGLVVAYPLGMAEGLAVYWVLGRWLRHH